MPRCRASRSSAYGDELLVSILSRGLAPEEGSIIVELPHRVTLHGYDNDASAQAGLDIYQSMAVGSEEEI